MRRILIGLLLIFAAMPIFGQSNNKKKDQKVKDDFLLKIEKINALLESYRILSPYQGNATKHGLIDSTGDEIISGLLKILNDKRVLQYELESHLDENGLSISKSQDNRIQFFSIDAKTGTPYKKNKTILHYRLLDGSVKAVIYGGEASEALATSAYGKVYLLDSLTRQYFTIGKVQTCNTCLASVAISLKLDSVSCQTDLLAQYEGRASNLVAFEYKPEVREFSLEYYAVDNSDSLLFDGREKQQLLHRFKSKFKYLYYDFFEIEKCEFLEKRD